MRQVRGLLGFLRDRNPVRMGAQPHQAASVSQWNMAKCAVELDFIDGSFCKRSPRATLGNERALGISRYPGDADFIYFVVGPRSKHPRERKCKTFHNHLLLTSVFKKSHVNELGANGFGLPQQWTQVVTTKAFDEEGGWVVQERGNSVRYMQARPGGDASNCRSPCEVFLLRTAHQHQGGHGLQRGYLLGPGPARIAWTYSSRHLPAASGCWLFPNAGTAAAEAP